MAIRTRREGRRKKYNFVHFPCCPLVAVVERRMIRCKHRVQVSKVHILLTTIRPCPIRCTNKQNHSWDSSHVLKGNRSEDYEQMGIVFAICVGTTVLRHTRGEFTHYGAPPQTFSGEQDVSSAIDTAYRRYGPLFSLLSTTSYHHTYIDMDYFQKCSL